MSRKLVFLRSNCKRRPTLPEGYIYVQPKEGTLYLKIGPSGRLSPVKGEWTNLLVRNLYWSYYYITRDQLIPLLWSFNSGKSSPDLEATPINLPKPI